MIARRGIENLLKLGVNRDCEGRSGFLLSNLDHALSNMLATHADKVQAALFNPKNAGKIYMLDDKRENFAVALRLMGKSLNETDEGVLKQAGEKLKSQAKRPFTARLR